MRSLLRASCGNLLSRFAPRTVSDRGAITDYQRNFRRAKSDTYFPLIAKWIVLASLVGVVAGLGAVALDEIVQLCAELAIGLQVFALDDAETCKNNPLSTTKCGELVCD